MANNNELKVIIGGDNKPLKAAFKDSERDANSFASVISGIGLGVGIALFEKASSAVSSFFHGAAEEAAEALRTVENLRQSLENVGRLDLLQNFQDTASELQQSFKFLDNDDITASFTKLIQLGGLTEGQMKKLIPVIIDFNAKQRLAGETNKSLADTTEQVVKALAGQGRELKQYGVEVKASNSETENLNILLTQLGSKVKGAGDAFANSLEGQIAATEQRVRDLQEELGNKLLPLKSKLLTFANEVADGFGLLYDRLTQGASAFNAVRDFKVKVNFVQNESNRKFDAIKDLPLDELTSELAKYQSALDRTNAAIKANKSGEAAITQWKLEAEVVGDLLGKIKEEIRLRQDTAKIGQNAHEGKTKTAKKETDALKEQIKTLEMLRRETGLLATEEIKLAGLKIQLVDRDGLKGGLNQGQIERIRGDIKSDLEESLRKRLIEIKIPVKFTPTVAVATDSTNSDKLKEGVARMVKVLEDAGEKAGEALRKKINDPLEQLKGRIQDIAGGAISSLGESLADIFSGGNPVAAFVTVISDALMNLGKALIAYAVVKKLALSALTKLDPSIALAAGVAAIAAGALLKKQLNSAPRLAAGGIVDRPTLAMIGEGGREAIVPLNRLGSMIENQNQGSLTGRIEADGDKLVVLINRVNKRNSRIGG